MIIVDPANNTADRPEGRKTLTLLVKRYPGYRLYPGLYPDFANVLLDAVDATAHPVEAPVNIKALNAILTQLAALPTFVADSEGSDSEKVFVSIAGNWEELAQTVLDTLYESPGGNATGSGVVFGSATRGLPPDCGPYGYRWLDERQFFGRRYL